MVIKTHNFKIFSLVLYGYHKSQIQIIALAAMAFSPYDFEMLPNLHMEFFWVGNPTYFLEMGRNYMSVIIKFFGYLDIFFYTYESWRQQDDSSKCFP